MQDEPYKVHQHPLYETAALIADLRDAINAKDAEIDTLTRRLAEASTIARDLYNAARGQDRPVPAMNAYHRWANQQDAQ